MFGGGGRSDRFVDVSLRRRSLAFSNIVRRKIENARGVLTRRDCCENRTPGTTITGREKYVDAGSATRDVNKRRNGLYDRVTTSRAKRSYLDFR